MKLPDEDYNDGGVSEDADDADNRNVHPQSVNEPVGGGVDDVTVTQPMIVQILSLIHI